MPSSLILEGLAQTGGLLVAQQHDFLRNVVLAKVSRAQFHLPAFPGDTLRYHAKIENLKLEGASVSLTSHIGDRLQAEADVFFAYVDEIADGQHLFYPEGFANWLRLIRLFEVGRYPDGRPLATPTMLHETLMSFGATGAGLDSPASKNAGGAANNGAAATNGPAANNGAAANDGCGQQRRCPC